MHSVIHKAFWYTGTVPLALIVLILNGTNRISSPEKTVAALTNKLKDLETILIQQGAAGGGTCLQPAQPTIKVSVPREKLVTGSGEISSKKVFHT